MIKNRTKAKLSLCLLLIFSILLSPVFSSVKAEDVSAFVEKDTSFDYASVMSEPLAYTQSGKVGASLSGSDIKSIKLYAGGIPFGVKFLTEGVLVVGFADISSGGKKVNPSQSAGLKAGDRIISVNGCELLSAEDLTKRVEESHGSSLSIVYLLAVICIIVISTGF